MTTSICSGLELLVRGLCEGVQHFALAGGEGARRLAANLEGALPQLEGEGVAGAMAALGAAATGARVALLASGESVFECLAALRQASALGVPLLLVCVSHGEDRGATLPAPTHEDLRALAAVAVPLWLASRPATLPATLRSALHEMREAGRPVAFACALGAVALRTEPCPSYDALEPALRCHGPDDAALLLLASGAAAESARAVLGALGEGVAVAALTRVKPRPWSALLPGFRAARAVLVHEPWPEPEEPGAPAPGALSTSLRAFLGDAMSDPPAVYTLLDEEPSPASWLDAVGALRLAPETRALTFPSHPLRAAPHETRVELRAAPERLHSLVPALLQRALEVGLSQSFAPPAGPTHALVVLAGSAPEGTPTQWLWLGEGGSWEPGTLASLPAGTAVLSSRETQGAALESLTRALALRGGALRHVHLAHEGDARALEALLALALGEASPLRAAL